MGGFESAVTNREAGINLVWISETELKVVCDSYKRIFMNKESIQIEGVIYSIIGFPNEKPEQ